MDFISLPEAARRYGFNRRYIAQMCRMGKFGTAFQSRGKFGKMEWLIMEDELKRYRDTSCRGPYRRKIRRIIREILF